MINVCDVVTLRVGDVPRSADTAVVISAYTPSKKDHCKLNLEMDTFHYIFFVHCKLLEAIIGCCISVPKNRH